VGFILLHCFIFFCFYILVFLFSEVIDQSLTIGYDSHMMVESIERPLTVSFKTLLNVHILKLVCFFEPHLDETTPSTFTRDQGILLYLSVLCCFSFVHKLLLQSGKHIGIA